MGRGGRYEHRDLFVARGKRVQTLSRSKLFLSNAGDSERVELVLIFLVSGVVGENRMTIRQGRFNIFPCHPIGDVIDQISNLELFGIGGRPLIVFSSNGDEHIGQSDQMKPDAGHPLGIIADGAARKGETASSRKNQQITGCRSGARLLEKLLPSLHPVGYARALAREWEKRGGKDIQ